MNEDTTPVTDTETEVITDTSTAEAAETVETEVTTPDGQGTKATADGQAYKDFDTLVKEKGWDSKTANEQLIKSYQDLEKKLGNWKEVEQRAGQYDTLSEKAQAWDRAQAYLEQMENKGEVDPAAMDLSKLPTDKLAQLWSKGVIGLNEVPKERQLEVQRFVQSQDTALEEHSKSEANRLIEQYPILKDSEVRDMVADQIEKGVVINGKELSPDEIVERVVRLWQRAEKNGEERITKTTQRIKEGNLESSDAAIKTKPVSNVTSVHDAFLAAKRELDEGN